ncbi:uncharacterized protein JCM6883_002107 [Sporobolomyces salmoneus]|uniref:uncharacterized protein n=1 Tax=Sporobolomyces salmoneus TaxID=183962 RepID=UPI003182A324
MASSSVHYRALSIAGLDDSTTSSTSSAPLLTRRSSIDVKPFSIERKYSDEPPSDAALLDEARSRQVRPLPKNSKCLRISAYLGWALAMLLLVVLLVGRSSVSPSEHIRSGLARVREHPLASKLFDDIGFSKIEPTAALKVSHASRPGGNNSTAGNGSKMVGGLKAPVTIVSSFYRIDSGKKHRVSEYHEWLTNFLGSVELPIIFYCAPSMSAYVRNLRGNKPLTIIADYNDPFEMPPLLSLGGKNWAKKQYELDPEQRWHVPDVYGVWTAKPWIARDASDRNPYDSEYFFWVDAGSFRDAQVNHDFAALPSVLEKTFSSLPSDTILLAATTEPFADGLDYVKAAKPGAIPDREDRLQGGWFGGKKEGVEMWEEAVKEVTVRQSALGRFAGKEQPIWTQAARLNWKKIYVQNMALRVGPDCGSDLWFGFEYFADGRDCEIPVWNGPEYALLDRQEEEKRRTR